MLIRTHKIVPLLLCSSLSSTLENVATYITKISRVQVQRSLTEGSSFSYI